MEPSRGPARAAGHLAQPSAVLPGLWDLAAASPPPSFVFGFWKCECFIVEKWLRQVHKTISISPELCFFSCKKNTILEVCCTFPHFIPSPVRFHLLLVTADVVRIHLSTWSECWWRRRLPACFVNMFARMQGVSGYVMCLDYVQGADADFSSSVFLSGHLTLSSLRVQGAFPCQNCSSASWSTQWSHL